MQKHFNDQTKHDFTNTLAAAKISLIKYTIVCNLLLVIEHQDQGLDEPSRSVKVIKNFTNIAVDTANMVKTI